MSRETAGGADFSTMEFSLLNMSRDLDREEEKWGIFHHEQI